MFLVFFSQSFAVNHMFYWVFALFFYWDQGRAKIRLSLSTWRQELNSEPGTQLAAFYSVNDAWTNAAAQTHPTGCVPACKWRLESGVTAAQTHPISCVLAHWWPSRLITHRHNAARTWKRTTKSFDRYKRLEKTRPHILEYFRQRHWARASLSLCKPRIDKKCEKITCRTDRPTDK